MVKDITVAQISSQNFPACEEAGENVADFMQKVYSKLAELIEPSN